ncbi:methyl-accepting chemotaxis protein [Cereibacter sphaeroides]|nr:methyl-accepting chemotaxis protein [Cereibacter sphaeroides]
MKLRHQVLALAAIPLLGLATVSVYLAGQEVLRVLDASRTELAVAEGVAWGDLVHRLQVERGQSAGFIASQGANFATTLPEMRGETDRVLADIGTLPDDIVSALSDLEAFRDRIDRQAANVPQVGQFYTAAVRAVMSRTQSRLLSPADPEIVRLSAGILALAEAKEAAGLQRAAGATGFGSGAFAPTVFQAFVERGATEIAQLRMAQVELGEARIDRDLTALAQGTAVAEMRSAVVSAGPNAAISSISGPQWFAAATEWIDTLRQVEIEVYQDIAAVSAAHSSSAALRLGLVVAVAFLAIGGSLFVALNVVKTFNGSFAALKEAMDRLGERDFDGWTRKAGIAEEIDTLFDTVERTRDALQDADQRIADATRRQREDVIDHLDAALMRLSNGDLLCQIETPFPPEFESLRDGFNEAVLRLRDTLGGVSMAVETFQRSSSDLNRATEDMSRRTGSQAAALEETTAALSQLSDMVAGTARSSRSAGQSATGLRSAAVEGRGRVDEAIAIMQKISKSSEEMTRMIALIDDISFQTNLLALNAGVEAARAGESGRGFAVVAGEVRALAVRSADTTNEIRSQIRASIAIVEEGVSLVEQAAKSFHQISEGVEGTTGAMEHIAGEAAAQASSIAEIKAAMESLDQVTQQNAAMVQESSDLIATLNHQSGDLSTLVGGFQTGKGLDKEHRRSAA